LCCCVVLCCVVLCCVVLCCVVLCCVVLFLSKNARKISSIFNNSVFIIYFLLGNSPASEFRRQGITQKKA
jgi:cell division protein FtsX